MRVITIIPPKRGQDSQGSGEFGAPRSDNRTHMGIDIACMEGSKVIAPAHGTVTKIGYPYNPDDPKKGHLRYVQITEKEHFHCRYFYVLPMVRVGDNVRAGDIIGIVQGLTKIYPGITDHFHYEVKSRGAFINPEEYLNIED